MGEENLEKRRGPALSPDELAGLVFDVPCLHCGKSVFTVPYVVNAHHVLTCSQCKVETWVLIDQIGGIKYYDMEKAMEKINYIVANLRPPPAPEYIPSGYTKFNHFEVRENIIWIFWDVRKRDDSTFYGRQEITQVNWTANQTFHLK